MMVPFPQYREDEIAELKATVEALTKENIEREKACLRMTHIALEYQWALEELYRLNLNWQCMNEPTDRSRNCRESGNPHPCDVCKAWRVLDSK